MKAKQLYLLILSFLLIISCSKEELPSNGNNNNNNGNTTTTKSSAKDITKFSFAALSPAVDATIDATAKTITATVPASTDITKLVPTITISDKATVSPATGVAQDFSKEVSYTVTAEDASTAVWKVNVKKDVTVGTSDCNITSFSTDYGQGFGGTITYEYDEAKKQITKLSYVSKTGVLNNYVTKFTYDSGGFLVERIIEKSTETYKTSFTYDNSRLVKETYTYTYKTDPPKFGSLVYEYESANSNKLKKIVSTSWNNIGTVTYDFKNGILVAKTWPNYQSYTVENGLIVSSTSADGKYTEKTTYDKDGQVVKESVLLGGVTTETVFEYTAIKNKYFDLNYSLNALSSGDIYIPAGMETVFGLNSFKGFPENYTLYNVVQKGKKIYVLKKTTSTSNDINQSKKVIEYNYNTDTNGNITSFIRTETYTDTRLVTQIQKVSVALTYKCY